VYSQSWYFRGMHQLLVLLSCLAHSSPLKMEVMYPSNLYILVLQYRKQICFNCINVQNSMSSEIIEVNGIILSLYIKILFKAVLEMILQWGKFYKIRDRKLLEWGHISTTVLVRWKIQIEVKWLFLDFSWHEEGMFLLIEIAKSCCRGGK
jgi:hypothetical protein